MNKLVGIIAVGLLGFIQTSAVYAADATDATGIDTIKGCADKCYKGTCSRLPHGEWEKLDLCLKQCHSDCTLAITGNAAQSNPTDDKGKE